MVFLLFVFQVLKVFLDNKIDITGNRAVLIFCPLFYLFQNWIIDCYTNPCFQWFH